MRTPIATTAATDKALGGHEFARAVANSQRMCEVCGNGMVILPWGDLVKVTDRLTVGIEDGTGTKRYSVHRYCFDSWHPFSTEE